ncbi:MAG: UDP-N-acetylmuramoyl-tripeptide--D-alanyl-D-alanine ligase [Acidobacteriota bacterium]|nr:UDP-N-acetylmuramoyl-tripeptide--D-alanyl-D-alanine ligase [Acidobacteriota bacterium]
MPELTIEEIAGVVKGEILNWEAKPGAEAEKSGRFLHYYFDTRDITSGQSLFFAMSGARDGHDFLPQLADKEGVAAVISQDFDYKARGIELPLIRVPDPLKAAQELAVYVRNKYRRIKYVGITGSAGKTTTKEFVYQLTSHKYRAYRSFLNWNNWIGMPFSLLNMKGNEDVAVFELAMSDPGIGEIDFLAGILRPDVAVLLNAFPVHLEFLESVDNVARGKAEILNHLAADDIAFINGDLDHVRRETRAKKGRKIYFGKNQKYNQVILEDILRNEHATAIVADFYGVEAQFDTPVINRVHVENLFAAIIVAQHLGMKHVEIQAALKEIKTLPGRGEIRHHGSFTIIDETYNSNPEALKKSLDWVDTEFKCAKIAVLGDMLELGKKEALFHREVGGYFAALGFERLITVGRRALDFVVGAAAKGFDKAKINSFDNASAAAEFLQEVAAPGSVILFKASRGIRLEKAVEEFCSDEK